MAVIKNGGKIANDWQHLANEEALPVTGPITVSLKRWQAERDALKAYTSPVGVRLSAADHPEWLEQEPVDFPLIVLDMQTFTDGRSFSQAQWIRERWGYRGEIRVRGDFLLDQVFYLSRVGVDAFEFSDEAQAEKALPKLGEFSVRYQAACDVRDPLYRRGRTGGQA